MELKICHLYPDVLNLYGDRGNIQCLQRRLTWRGIECQVDFMGIGDHKSLSGYDLFFIGGGQDFDQEILLEDLRLGKGAEIRSALEDGRTFLCICGGYQMMGHFYETAEGKRCEFLGAIDFYTVGGRLKNLADARFSNPEVCVEAPQTSCDPSEKSPTRISPKGAALASGLLGKERMIGNYAFRLGEESGGSVVVGFENHSGRTFLGGGVRPLGRILGTDRRIRLPGTGRRKAGYGNNGVDHTEGARYRNAFCTYSHGPVLPKNPAFADVLLETALKRKYGSCALEPLPDRFEHMAHDAVLKRVIR